jgi:hypothetical protein
VEPWILTSKLKLALPPEGIVWVVAPAEFNAKSVEFAGAGVTLITAGVEVLGRKFLFPA